MAALLCPLHAAVTLGPLFSDHMVLQREKPIVIYGKADPGETVTVEFLQAKASTRASAKGVWELKLPPQVANSTPSPLVVTASNRIEVNDVVVGEVWLCAGQSNMAMLVKNAARAAAEVAAADQPLIREFKVRARFADAPADTYAGEWKRSSPAHTGDFSATAYFFAQKLQRELGVPVGIITSAYGNTSISSWRSPEALSKEPTVGTWWKEQLAAKTPPRPHRMPSSCYNGMIHPLAPLALRGFLWYQGEGDATVTPTFTTIYARQLSGLISEWRELFGGSTDLPFYWVQLAGYGDAGARDWVGLREQQQAVVAVKHTGQAIALDIGEAKDIHPKNKQAVGDRLARLALRRTYGRDIVDSGPHLLSAKTDDASVRLQFANADGLATAGETAAAFELAGPDGTFHAASVLSVDGPRVRVESDAVKRPVSLRFGWQNLPPGFLFNAAGLPAAPFRVELK